MQRIDQRVGTPPFVAFRKPFDHLSEIAMGVDGQGHAIIEARDTGVGLRNRELEHLFESFYTTKAGGKGMDLAICRSIAETHGERIGAGAEQAWQCGVSLRHPCRTARLSALKPAAAGAVCGCVCAAGACSGQQQLFSGISCFCAARASSGAGWLRLPRRAEVNLHHASGIDDIVSSEQRVYPSLHAAVHVLAASCDALQT
ncbi:ATP-binding protein [Paraburkholderia sp. 40]|uniref:ATP-binding protein n=1 Tax=Paraburkholderia sp. 40 TaxID=2991059 RepID=UPI003D1A0B18